VKEIISNSGEETMNLAKKIAPSLKLGDVIILTGDLGSGKTKFVEGILEYFGLQDEISSPTFTIVNEYNAKNQNIYHFDVYRLEDVDEFYAIGGDEYFDKGICLIEWGECVLEALPQNYKTIAFSRDLEHENKRVLKFEGFEDIDF
jgi:tRNA threonylcarbamoyladenosine biosynthesis protein TsaE